MVVAMGKSAPSLRTIWLVPAENTIGSLGFGAVYEIRLVLELKAKVPLVGDEMTELS